MNIPIYSFNVPKISKMPSRRSLVLFTNSNVASADFSAKTEQYLVKCSIDQTRHISHCSLLGGPFPIEGKSNFLSQMRARTRLRKKRKHLEWNVPTYQGLCHSGRNNERIKLPWIFVYHLPTIFIKPQVNLSFLTKPYNIIIIETLEEFKDIKFERERSFRGGRKLVKLNSPVGFRILDGYGAKTLDRFAMIWNFVMLFFCILKVKASSIMSYRV